MGALRSSTAVPEAEAALSVHRFTRVKSSKTVIGKDYFAAFASKSTPGGTNRMSHGSPMIPSTNDSRRNKRRDRMGVEGRSNLDGEDDDWKVSNSPRR